MVESLYNISPAERDKLEKLAKESYQAENNLMPEHAVDQNLAAEFTCGICHIMVNPQMVECNQCKAISCEKCIENCF